MPQRQPCCKKMSALVTDYGVWSWPKNSGIYSQSCCDGRA